MAQFETWIDSDLAKPIKVVHLTGNLFSQDAMSNVIGVNVYNNGVAAALSGTVTGYVVRADGATVLVSGASYVTLSGNKASIKLPQSAYIVPGVISIVVKLTTGSIVTTLGAVTGVVYRTSTDTIVDPGRTIPSLDELLAKIDEMETATTAANTAASAATTAASAIDNMTVAASTLAAGSNATATVSTVSGHKHIAFGIPQGEQGIQGPQGPQGPQGLKGDAGNGDMIADDFSASSAYSAGDYVIYNGTLYRFSADHAAGAWTGTDAAAVQLAEDVTELKSAFNATDALLVGDGKANVDLWESGSISGIGGNISYNARIRIKTDKRIGLAEGQLAVTCADGYEMFFSAYNSEWVYVGKLQTDGKIGDGDGAWTQSLNLIAYPDYVFRIVLRNKTTPTAEIAVSESSNVFFHGEKYGEKIEGVETSPYVFNAINVNIESGIYDRWNNFYQTGKHVSIPVSEGEKYLIVAGSFPSTDYPLYLLKKDNSVVGYKNVSSSQMVQEELTVNDADTLIINSNKAYISVCKGYAVTAKPFSKWAGKKITWFGTSIPETSTYNAVLGYPEYVGKLLGATVYNEAVGSSTARRGFKTAETENDPYGWTGMGIAALWNMGSTIAEKNEIINNWESKWRSLTGYNAAMTDGISAKALACSYENKLVQKYITENPVDLYVFDHGYNDWKVGDLDMNPDDPYDRSTFQGAMNTFIKLIMESNPHARILIVSHYEDQERPGLIEMQKGEAEYWNLPFARLYDRLGWANNRTVTTTGYWSNGTGNGYWIKSGGTEQTLTLKQYHMPDGRHPNIDISGRACMDIAHVLAEMIDSITPAS